jgi:predicted AAA+ superfamily ATPase
VLTEIANSYLLKDILAFDRVKSSRTLLDLLKLMAFQMGSEVSLNEMGTQLGVDTKTVQRYLNLLEKAFVIVRLGGLSRNLRQEVRKKYKYFFLDTGIRNAIIAQFNSLDLRNDVRALWENFMIMERLKYRTYAPLYANMYFWRTYDQQEIDLVEERDGNFHAYDFKWSQNKPALPPANWTTAYPDAEYSVITPANFGDFALS